VKSKSVAYLLWVLFGWAGIHRFYCGRWFTGSLWLLTCGLFGAGWFMDAITTSTLVDPSNGLPRAEVSTWVQKELRALRNVGLTLLGILGFVLFLTVSVWVAQKLDTTTPEQKAQDAVKANGSAVEAERVARRAPAEFTIHVDKAYGFSILYDRSPETRSGTNGVVVGGVPGAQGGDADSSQLEGSAWSSGRSNWFGPA
jgi:hypothetical protein